MPSRLRFTLFIVISLILHILILGAAVSLFPAKTTRTPIPVEIVELPKELKKKLPRPKPRQPRLPVPTPERIDPKGPPIPPVVDRFDDDPEVMLPQTEQREEPGIRDNGETYNDRDEPAPPKKDKGPLPFLSQDDIGNLARRGMPRKKPGDNSITLDTDEYKFISYNRWLKVKVESVLNYPELAALSGYQGTLYVKFEIMKDGSLGSLELIKSSGYKILDDEALRSLRSAAPFQPLPDNWGMDRYPIRAAFLFYLNGAYIR